MTDLIYFIAQGSATGKQGNYILIVMMLGFILFFYFAVVRPQNKKKKEMKSMLDALKKNDRIITIGGIHGKVVNVKDNTVTVKIDDSAEITFDKNAISRVVDQKAPKPEENKKEEKNSSENK